jgi:general secretion pathway protein B
MSSILDALKKSERQRSLGRDLIFRNASPDAPVRLTGFAIAVLAVLVILVVALGALLLISLREPEPPAVTTTSMPGEPSPSADRGTSPAQEISKTTAEPASTARTDTLPPLDSQVRPSAHAAAPPTKPVTVRPPTPVVSPQVAASPALPTGTGEVPWLSSLPEAFRRSLPPLSVNIHVYSPDESQRILYINNRPAQQGERIEGGVVVEEIVEDGVVLQYRGQRFKLPRPS